MNNFIKFKDHNNDPVYICPFNVVAVDSGLSDGTCGIALEGNHVLIVQGKPKAVAKRIDDVVTAYENSQMTNGSTWDTSGWDTSKVQNMT